MLSLLQNWILAIFGTALVCGVVRALAPEGIGKRAVAVVCGFVMLGALLGVRGDLGGGSVERGLEGFTAEAEEYARRAREAGQAQTRFIIEENCEAYILDKAKALGVPADGASVTARWSEKGFWVPAECAIDASFDAALSGAVASELGIPPEDQTWRTDDG